MALEIEHKFLVNNNDWKEQVSHSVYYKQGYLHSDEQRSIRIRISDEEAWLNIKSATIGSSRQEYEYSIPLNEADEMLNTLCHKPLIEKKRYFVPIKQHVWEVDVFDGDNSGLIVAEIELSQINENFFRPNWLGLEVTEDIRYYNNSLCVNPYKLWK